MTKEANNIENLEVFKWQIPEYDKHERTKTWYLRALIVMSILMFFALFSITFIPLKIYFEPNFLFIIILILFTMISIINDGHNPAQINFIIYEDGISVGRKFYDYDEIKNFYIIYKPKSNVKNLYFDFKNEFKPRLSIPFMSKNPIPIRDFLLNFLEENLDKTGVPISEGIAKLLKI